MSFLSEQPENEEKKVESVGARSQSPKQKGPIVHKSRNGLRSAKKKNRYQEDKLVNRIVSVIVLIVIVALISGGFYAYRYIATSLQPLDSEDKEIVFVEIPIGSSNKAIGKILEENEIIKDGTIFNFYTKFNNLSGFQAGRYQFSPSMTLNQIGDILKTGGLAADQADARVTIPEGFDLTQIAEAVAAETAFSKEAFLKLMEDATFLTKLEQKYPALLTDVVQEKDVRYALEGYLFPATYDYFESMTLESFVTQMVAKTNEVMSSYYEQIEESDWNVHEILTLASLVEKEGVTEEDRRLIAQVFFNRLAVDMPLQSDISILYALGVHKELVTYEDTAVDSPYNLYVNKGFGPGPFNSPGEMAIQAVLEPTANDYYYFVADLATGAVYFSSTLEEHNVLVEQYVNKTQ
ncbi:endolytic transglycosylase MltG [Enterococcus lemanii]|uniref:endolytic transglycosylase MltG n=1 Tax=Enterococcus lemanii TaxID=1159752 RepID=UPI00195E51BC